MFISMRISYFVHGNFENEFDNTASVISISAKADTSNEFQRGCS